MAYLFTAEQQALKETLRAFFQAEITSDVRRELLSGNASLRLDLWERFRALGIRELFDVSTATVSDEAASFRELYLIAFEAGRVASPEPFAASILGGQFLLNRVLTSGEKRDFARKAKAWSPEYQTGLLNGEALICTELKSAKIEPSF